MGENMKNMFRVFIGLATFSIASVHGENYVVNERPAMTLVGIECRTSNHPDAGPKDILKHWEKFFNEGIYGQIPNKSSPEVMALYCKYEGDYTKPYSLIIGCLVNSTDDLPENLVVHEIPATNYAVFKAAGEHPKTLIDTWEEIWAMDIDRTYSGDFEVYGEKFAIQSPPEVDIYIAIQS